MRMLLLTLCLTLIPAVYCIPTLDDGQACTTLYAYGVTVNVTNADTGAVITNAVLTLTDGDYTEVMQPFPSGGYVGAGERAGNYTLTVDVPGLATGTVDNVDVTAGRCHVMGVALDIQVSPSVIVVNR